MDNSLPRISSCIAATLAASLAGLGTLASLPALAADSVGTAATDTGGNTRYVWADNLSVRAAPDVKAEVLAHLPLGAPLQLLASKDVPVHYEESVQGLKRDPDMKGKPLKISGTWRLVQLAGKQGWVFDGYLSRYPYPRNNKDSDPVAGEFAAAKALFGIKSEQQWVSGDPKGTATFQAMPQYLRDSTAPENEADISWDRVVFNGGGSGEFGVDSRFGGTGSTVALDNLPMTYQEALLWAKRWGWFGEYGVALQDGHARLRYAYEDMKADLAYNIDCQATVCSIRYSYGTE